MARVLFANSSDRQVQVVGESYYQENLLRLAGGEKREESVALRGNAVLVPEPENKHDLHAVVVHIGGMPVGYLDRRDAKEFQSILRDNDVEAVVATAHIRGGWLRAGSEGHFGVVLMMDWPPRGEVQVLGAPD